MIRSIVLWLAMMGQGQQPLDLSCAAWAMAEAHGNKWVCLKPTSAHYEPAEHVIEIRTKREVIKTAKDTITLKCPAGTVLDCPGDSMECDLVCERVTKTLWIDGVRVGVIREVEEP